MIIFQILFLAKSHLSLLVHYKREGSSWLQSAFKIQEGPGHAGEPASLRDPEHPSGGLQPTEDSQVATHLLDKIAASSGTWCSRKP